MMDRLGFVVFSVCIFFSCCDQQITYQGGFHPEKRELCHPLLRSGIGAKYWQGPYGDDFQKADVRWHENCMIWAQTASHDSLLRDGFKDVFFKAPKHLASMAAAMQMEHNRIAMLIACLNDGLCLFQTKR